MAITIKKADSCTLDCNCGQKPVAVIGGGENCYYCGNEIPLCADCLMKLRDKINVFQCQM